MNENPKVYQFLNSLPFTMPCNFWLKVGHDALGNRNCGQQLIRVKLHASLAVGGLCVYPLSLQVPGTSQSRSEGVKPFPGGMKLGSGE